MQMQYAFRRANENHHLITDSVIFTDAYSRLLWKKAIRKYLKKYGKKHRNKTKHQVTTTPKPSDLSI
ncbi:hypothetical protein KSF78_0001101 [Schistosoma japonicum]|nr:hypothetical protein KSF78_0001101 [Schistosoma japonicum]